MNESNENCLKNVLRSQGPGQTPALIHGSSPDSDQSNPAALLALCTSLKEELDLMTEEMLELKQRMESMEGDATLLKLEVRALRRQINEDNESSSDNADDPQDIPSAVSEAVNRLLSANNDASNAAAVASLQRNSTEQGIIQGAPETTLQSHSDPVPIRSAEISNDQGQDKTSTNPARPSAIEGTATEVLHITSALTSSSAPRRSASNTNTHEVYGRKL